jgi:transposase
MKTESQIARQYEQLRASLDERGRREWAASEAVSLGHGGIAKVHRATGIVPSTIGKGIRELRMREHGAPERDEPRRVRRPGGGRKRKVDKDQTLLADLEKLVEPTTRGEPESPLRWTCKSLRNLAGELVSMGHAVSYRTVGRLLKTLGYSLQANRKTFEGSSHPDRDAQFHYISQKSKEQLAAGNPAISVDTKKKELVGNYKNGGREFSPSGKPEEVKAYDFVGELGRANPYGVYDIGQDAAWVSVGVSSDTAEFAVEAIRRWYNCMGRERYPHMSELLITADCGGSNGYRIRLWKLQLQRLANELGIPITVCHFPPGTSKWNKIEHRLFSFIAMNWRGKPLIDYQTIVSLIAATTTEKGLEVRCELDENTYEKGRKVSDTEMSTINTQPHEFHGEWNYTISPENQNCANEN